MPKLDDIIRYLRSFSEYSAGGAGYNAESVIEAEYESIADTVYNAAATAIGTAYELNKAPPLKDHLLKVFREKIDSPNYFFKLTGIKFNQNMRLFRAEPPDLTPLGNAADWKNMKEAGHNLYEVKRVSQSAAQKLAGWKWFYNSWLNNWNRSGGRYKAIIEARLGWGRSARKAPYWYFFDDGSSGEGYPKKQSVHIATSINRKTSRIVMDLNKKLSEVADDNIMEVITEDAAQFSEDYTEAKLEGRPLPDPAKIELFRFFGTITTKGVKRRVTKDELKALEARKVIKRSRPHRNNPNMFHYYMAKGGYFVGTYATKLME